MFNKVLDQHSWESEQESILRKTEADVREALERTTEGGMGHTGQGDLEAFKALISPAAQPYLEDMARLSQQLTRERFGKTIQMYAPLYLSNECHNQCTYCGFSMENQIPRRTLAGDELLREADYLRNQGFEHVLLVSGEAPREVGVSYFKESIRLLRDVFAQISLEVQPLNEEDYRELMDEGLHAVLVYQETYRKETYRDYHTRGKKSHFNYRLQTADRLGTAGIHKIGLGALIGLEDWRTDAFFTALHLMYLEKTYWKTRYAVSLPRLRPFEGAFQPKVHMTDREFVQLICAYRLLDPDVELSLSTREPAAFRDHLFSLGVTSVSAGSKTNPGGYAVEPESLEQFSIDDNRSPAEVADAIRKMGYTPVWKDWHPVLG